VLEHGLSEWSLFGQLDRFELPSKRVAVHDDRLGFWICDEDEEQLKTFNLLLE
jgi:hypothetical protein